MAGGGFAALPNDTAREYLINAYSRMTFHVMRDEGMARSKCYAIAMKLRRKLLSGETAFPSIDVRDERRKLTGRCTYCDQAAETVDHLIPRLREGPASADNLVPACRWCNSSKSGQDVFEWANSKGFFPLPVIRRYLVLAWRWTENAGLLDASMEELRASTPPFHGDIPWVKWEAGVPVILKRQPDG